ncbi:hypothetical protein GLYMA_03G073716v4 [Glycine max]|uniref:Uncharacterized protein n=1 Tax=Glycine max TaxID=3847 RepID=A0A0R0KHM5_SOYBN|nr:hypothetical protein GLYMA_03G073716v4 [Glycine max]KAH1068950.1 hypothetical protein GYH30_006502 [Glycine max]
MLLNCSCNWVGITKIVGECSRYCGCVAFANPQFRTLLHVLGGSMNAFVIRFLHVFSAANMQILFLVRFFFVGFVLIINLILFKNGHYHQSVIVIQ